MLSIVDGVKMATLKMSIFVFIIGIHSSECPKLLVACMLCECVFVNIGFLIS